MISSDIHIYKDLSALKKFLFTNITDSAQLLVQLFLISTDETYINEILKLLNTYLPNSHIIGATTDGSIVCNDNTDVTTISFTQFEKSQLQHVFVPFELTQEDKCAQIIAKKILNKNSKLLIIFADGLLCNASKLTQEFSKLYPEIIIAGGLAGDNAKLKKTLVCDNYSISSQFVVALSMESDSLLIHTDYNLAWDIIGDTMEVTKCHDNIIYEINGKKAVDIFQNYFNKQHLKHYTADKSRPTISIEFPIILNRGDMKVARVLLKMNEDGSIFCSGEFVIGNIISFSFTNNQKIIQSAIDLSYRM